jgi:hypothetical protein
MPLTLPQQKYGTNDQRRQFLRRLDERLVGFPAFLASSLSSDLPLYPLLAARRTLTVDGRERAIGEAPPTAVYITVGPRYFDTVRLSPVRGRPVCG